MITVFTPIYNREQYLRIIYNSLKMQTDKNFIWLIIDDGSTDNTKKIIEEIIKEKKINIEYYFQENQGKHIAYNNACKKCKTKFMICLDSDDVLTKDAIEILRVLSNKMDSNIWGIVGPRVHNDGTLETTWNIPNNSKIKFLDIYQKYKYIGETYILLNMEIARNNMFPKFDNEKLVPENVIYDILDNENNVIASNKLIYVSDYKNDGYTKNPLKTFSKSLKGACYASLIRATCKSSNIQTKLKSYARYKAIKNVFQLKDPLIEIIYLEKKIKIFSIPYYCLLYIRYYIKKMKIKKWIGE